MARSSLFTLFDAMASLLDDAARQAPVGTRQAAEAAIARAWSLLGTVFQRGLRGKLLLVLALLALCALLPWPPLLTDNYDNLLEWTLMALIQLCGAYQCYEGLERVASSWRRPAAERGQDDAARIAAALKGAVRTDLVASTQCIALACLAAFLFPPVERVLFIALAAFLLAVVMYAPIAGVVLLAGLGLDLAGREEHGRVALPGRVLLSLAPWLLRGLSWFGLVATLALGVALVTSAVNGFRSSASTNHSLIQ